MSDIDKVYLIVEAAELLVCHPSFLQLGGVLCNESKDRQTKEY
jgi:hypothetical protein